MAERKTATRKVLTEKVQGKGSYVKFKALTWGETRALSQMKEGKTNEEAADEICKLLTKHVIDWNWVDDEGNALLLPESGETWMDALTKEEVSYLMDKATD